MIINNLVNYIQCHRVLIIFSCLLSIAFGGTAALYPISYVATLNIPNDEGYFSLLELKRIKSQLPIEAPRLLSLETDILIKQLIQKTISEPKWVEKNITPTFAITKSDAKELFEANYKLDSLQIPWINVQVASQDSALARREAKWIAELLCKLSYVKILKDYLLAIRNQADAQLLTNYAQIPNIELQLDETKEKLRIIKDISQKYPEQPVDSEKFQFNLSAGERTDNLSSLSFLTAYLPAIRQIAILETQLVQAEAGKQRIGYQIQLLEAKRKTAVVELMSMQMTSVEKIFKGNNVVYEFWSKLNLDKDLSVDAPTWIKNSAVETKNALREQELISVAHFERQLSQLENIYVELKYSRNLLVLAGSLIGLLGPSFVKLVQILIKNVSRDEFVSDR